MDPGGQANSKIEVDYDVQSGCSARGERFDSSQEERGVHLSGKGRTGKFRSQASKRHDSGGKLSGLVFGWGVVGTTNARKAEGLTLSGDKTLTFPRARQAIHFMPRQRRLRLAYWRGKVAQGQGMPLKGKC
ncbi:hypothetical protein JTB14_025032 [Gonioctena quinquepunctata]|nr:hypothetical protein JTB14_025032 [Gonioctena quinquepunctata]